MGDFFMLQVVAFDEENEQDLSDEMNRFLKTIDENQLVDIRFSVSAFLTSSNEQVYCYCALIIYRIMVK